MKKSTTSRRQFLDQTAKASLAFTIIPRFVLGGNGFTAPSDQLTIGFVGTGKQGRGLLNGFAAMSQVVAASDVDQRKLELFRSNAEKKYAEIKGQTSYGGMRTYADFREMLERKDIDAVVVATPDHWHAVATVMAANTGKHVYCEKPLAHSVEEGRAMVNAVAKNKVVLQTGSMQRSWDNFRKACELVRNGYVGDIKEVWVSVGAAGVPCYLLAQEVPPELNWDMWVGPALYRAFHPELSPPVEEDIFPHWRNYKEFGGGILSDWGAHMFDIAQWALDMDRSGPVQYLPPKGKDHPYLTMIYQNGIVMKHLDFGRGFGVRFHGSKGTLDISREYLDSKPGNIAAATLRPGEQTLYKSTNHLQNWIDSIRSNTPPICDAETGHRSSTVCCLANIAYCLGRPLDWDPVKEQFKNDPEANKLLRAPMREPWKIT